MSIVIKQGNENRDNKMGHKAILKVAKHSKAAGADLALLLILASRANDSRGECWPSVSTLAKECNCTRRSLQKTLRRLEQQGEITITPDGGWSSGHGGPKSNLYAVKVAVP